MIDVFHEIKKGNRHSYSQALKKLKTIQFETIYCPHESLRTAFFVRKLHAHQKIGFQKWWNGYFFTVRIQKIKSLPEALRQLQMLAQESFEIREKLNAYAAQHESGEMAEVPPWATMTVDLEKQNKELICIFPGSVWATKKWTLQGFCELAQALSETNTVVLLGGEEERELGNEIQKFAPRVQNQIGLTSLDQTLKVLSQAKLVITNDSGGQHLAALVGAPTISIFGPTVLDFGYRPWNPNAVVVENSAIACRPCGSHGHQKCPRGTHECMTSISSERVFNEAKKLIGLA